LSQVWPFEIANYQGFVVIPASYLSTEEGGTIHPVVKDVIAKFRISANFPS